MGCRMLRPILLLVSHFKWLVTVYRLRVLTFFTIFPSHSLFPVVFLSMATRNNFSFQKWERNCF